MCPSFKNILRSKTPFWRMNSFYSSFYSTLLNLFPLYPPFYSSPVPPKVCQQLCVLSVALYSPMVNFGLKKWDSLSNTNAIDPPNSTGNIPSKKKAEFSVAKNIGSNKEVTPGPFPLPRVTCLFEYAWWIENDHPSLPYPSVPSPSLCMVDREWSLNYLSNTQTFVEPLPFS